MKNLDTGGTVMKENTKKRLVIAGLAAVCVLLVFGISRVLYKEPVQSLPEESRTEEDTELVIDDGEISKLPESDSTEDVENTEEEKELVIDIQPETGQTESGLQEIQKEPEKTEDEKPQEPPALEENADVTNPETPPAYEEPEKTTPPTDNTSSAETTPSHGDRKDGMIYIDGFGWITDNGGGGSGTVADDMYENGNKVGIMD